jgi:hypothetical protein
MTLPTEDKNFIQGYRSIIARLERDWARSKVNRTEALDPTRNLFARNMIDSIIRDSRFRIMIY